MQGASSSNNANTGPAPNRNKTLKKYNNTVIDKIMSSDKQEIVQELEV